MAAGLVVWDDSGNVVMDTTTRTSRLLGRVQVTGGGSLSDAGFSTGTPFAVQTCFNGEGVYNSLNITFSGNTMTWTPVTTPNASKPINHIIVYGVY